jgi:hypothetical protein
MARFLRRGALFLLVLAVLSLGLSTFYERVVMADSFLLRRDRQYRAYKGKLDFLFLGDSHVHRGIDPTVIGRSFNFGCASENYMQSYYKLSRILLEPGPARDCRVVVMPFDLHSFSSYRSARFRHAFYWKRYVDFLDLGRRKGNIPRYLGKLGQGTLVSYWGQGDDFQGYFRSLFSGREGLDELRLGFIVSHDDYALVKNHERRGRERASHQLRGHVNFDRDFVQYFGLCLRLVRNRGKRMVLVRYPVTAEYLDHAEKLVTAEPPPEIQRAIEKTGAVILDYRRAFLGRKDLFSDPNHLNETGARELSAALKIDLEALLEK